MPTTRDNATAGHRATQAWSRTAHRAWSCSNRWCGDASHCLSGAWHAGQDSGFCKRHRGRVPSRARELPEVHDV